MGSQESTPSDDMVFDILTWLKSLETLDTCKSVCKKWEEMIYESSFMPLFCSRSRMLSGFFIQDMVDNKFFSMFAALDDGSTSSDVSITRLPDDTKILGSCNHGILCCVRRSGKNYRYYVCKPTTQQWQPLPNPKLRYETVFVAVMVLGSDRCLFLKSYKEYYTYRCEIFDSKTWRWREVEGVTVRYTELIIDSVTINNVVYWLTNEDNVIAFHEGDELLYKFSLPEKVVQKSDRSLYDCKRLVEYKGRLGLTFLTEEGKTALWPTRDDGRTKGMTAEWMREEKGVIVIDTENLDQKHHVQYPYLAGFYNAGIAFLKGFQEVVFYRFGDHDDGLIMRRVELDHKLRDARDVLQFRSDLELVCLGRVS